MEFVSQYGIFLAKAITIVVALIVTVGSIVAAGQRHKKHEKQGYVEITNLNDKYGDMAQALRMSVLSDDEYKAFNKAEKKAKKAKDKEAKKQSKQAGESTEAIKTRVFVIDFVGDIRASACASLAEQVTTVLTQGTAHDEVVVRLESAGGMVHSYGLAASQLQRIRDKGIPLTVCVDKVAASGGYMMACIANKVLSAPFAVLGSIGVVAQIPNLHRLLKKNDIDYDTLTAGEYKRTMTVFGENTDKGRQKFQQELEDTHELFKAFVSRHRPAMDMAVIATGETWFGQKALEKLLVDAIQTSDDYLYERHHTAQVYQLRWIEKHSVAERLGLAAEMAFERVAIRSLDRLTDTNSFLR